VLGKPCTGTSIDTCARPASENGTSVELRGPPALRDQGISASTVSVPRSG
jgi:hypothetical protein